MSSALTPVTTAMASAGAVILRSLPWSGEVIDPMEVARKVWAAMDRQREVEEKAATVSAGAARRAANTPWNTPPRGDGPKAA